MRIIINMGETQQNAVGKGSDDLACKFISQCGTA